jgi:hypothetical protein
VKSGALQHASQQQTVPYSGPLSLTLGGRSEQPDRPSPGNCLIALPSVALMKSRDRIPGDPVPARRSALENLEDHAGDCCSLGPRPGDHHAGSGLCSDRRPVAHYQAVEAARDAPEAVACRAGGYTPALSCPLPFAQARGP